jgi:hypothetical protein
LVCQKQLTGEEKGGVLVNPESRKTGNKDSVTVTRKQKGRKQKDKGQGFWLTGEEKGQGLWLTREEGQGF